MRTPSVSLAMILDDLERSSSFFQSVCLKRNTDRVQVLKCMLL